MNPFGGIHYRQMPTQKPVRNPFDTIGKPPQNQEAQNPAQFQQPESSYTGAQKKLLAQRPGLEPGQPQNQWHAATYSSFWGNTPQSKPKADRSIAIGLNKRFLGTVSGQQEEQNNPFSIPVMNDDHAKPNIFDPCPHFLAEA